ncbi:hypothetical protein [Geomonas agri]|uniref:hypothetical protein n=1 Tax=Geomonas agri TaxID=2873702 RepID=UPI001CD4801E|nr:hypothetical protein [Geomonas agri]
MKRRFGKFTAAAALALLGSMAGSAYASSIVKTFNVWNQDATVGNYGTVTVDDTEASKIKFVVDANDRFLTAPAITSAAPRPLPGGASTSK